MSQLQNELFARGPAAPVDVAPEASRWRPVAARLPAAVRLGTSSWSFVGWRGLVYDRETTPAVLARDGLAAYARHPLLRAVGVDRSYYEALPREVFERYARQVPSDFRFMVKMQRNLVTPGHPHFLDAGWAWEWVIGPAIAGLGDKLGTLLLQFSPMRPDRIRRDFGGTRGFAEALYRFLRAIGEHATTAPRSNAADDRPAIAVEIRSPELCTEDYAQALHHAGAVHSYVVHPAMAPLRDQLERLPPGPGPLLIRWMLAPGASYEAAKQAWAPFARVRRPDGPHREIIVDALRNAARRGVPATLIVNNKAEGSSPRSIEAIAEALTGVPPTPGPA